MYTGELLVSPPNTERILGSFDGFLDLLWENFFKMGESDPDSFRALDFDDINLNFLLHTSELPSFNRKDYYSYENTNNYFSTYDAYYANTLGFLETKVKKVSNNQFDAIRPTIIDGAPHYEFINSTLYQTVLPLSVLYKPIVLSEARYNQINPTPGHLIITTQCKDFSKTKGIDPYAISPAERQADYKVKIPINTKGFEYPIKDISIDIIKEQLNGVKSYYARDISIDESYYIIDTGNLYFNKSIEEIIFESYQGFKDILKQPYSIDLIGASIYYKIHIIFDRFVPDTTDETNNLALAQATFYTIMDYFNQYTYAQVSANMIAEIAYTETLTFWSTLISAPLVYLGSYTIKGSGAEKIMTEAGVQVVKSSLSKTLIQIVTAPIKEVFEEIIKDGLMETLLENVVSMVGGSDDLGFWLSSLATSAREVGGALGTLARGGSTNLKTTITLAKAINSGDSKTAVEIALKINQDLKQKQDAELKKKAEMKTWQKLVSSGCLKGIFMLTTSIFLGGSSFFTLSGLKNTYKSIKSLGELKTIAHANRKAEVLKITEHQGTLEQNLEKQNKKPDGVTNEIFNILFRGSQDTEITNLPLTITFPQINPNPKNTPRKTLAQTFNEIRVANIITELKKYRDIEKQQSKLQESTVKLTSDKKGNEGMFPELDKDQRDNLYNMIYQALYQMEDKASFVDEIRKIPYPADLINDAINTLTASDYEGVPIIFDQEINIKVQEKIVAKFRDGQQLNQLETLIMDVGTMMMGHLINFDMSGKVNSESDFIEKSIEKVKENQKRIAMADVIGDSMYQLFGDGSEVPIIEMPDGTTYEVGDIIVFKSGGFNVIHRVEYVFTYNGETYYVTEGINNKFVDDALITGNQIIGKADFSKETFEAAQELAKQNKLRRYRTYAKPELNVQQRRLKNKLENRIADLIANSFTGYGKIANEIFGSTKLFTELFRDTYGIQKSRSKSTLSLYRDLIIVINDLSAIRGINENDLNVLKQDLLEICASVLIKVNGLTIKKLRNLQLEKSLPLDIYENFESYWQHYQYYHIFEKLFTQKYSVENDLYQGKWINPGCIKWQREILWQLSGGRDFFTGQKFTDIYKLQNPDGLTQYELETMSDEKLEAATMRYISRHHFNTHLTHKERTKDCRVSAVVLVWKDYERVIHDRIHINPLFGKTYAIRFENTIKQLLQGNAPTTWLPQYRTEFHNINRNSENAQGILYLFYQQFF